MKVLIRKNGRRKNGAARGRAVSKVLPKKYQVLSLHKKFLFFMLMGKQVILAVFVVAHTFGAEPELQILSVFLRPAAYGTPVMGAPLGGCAHLLGIGSPPLSLFGRKPVPVGGQIEDNKVQKGDQRRHTGGGLRQDADLYQGKIGRYRNTDQACHDRHAKIQPIENPDPLTFNGQDKEQQELHVRVQHGKGQQKRRIEIVRAQRQVPAKQQIHHQARDHMEEHAGEIIEVEAERAPLVFQHPAHEIIQIQGEHDKEKPFHIDRHRRSNDKGNDPPDLSMQDLGRVQAQPLFIQSRRHNLQYKAHRIQYNDIIDQVVDRIFSKPALQFVNPVHMVSFPPNG